METPITFPNRSGCKLFGMLYTPDRPAARRVGVIICVNAVKYRLGTFRLHVLLARRLASLSYHVMSFDPEGIGDSEGVFAHKLLSEHYHDIQTGKYDKDLAAAVEFFVDRCELDAVVLLGLCGGAISVVIEGSRDPKVNGVVLLNTPVLLENLQRQGVEDNAAKITSSRTAATLMKGKLHRLIEWNFWSRLLRFQVDLREEFSLVRRALLVLIRQSVRWTGGVLGTSSRRAGPERPVSSNRLFNTHFQSAFFAAQAAKKRLLLVFAELDPWTGIFDSEFHEPVFMGGLADARYVTLERVAAANHIFSSPDSQKELDRRIIAWLSEHYPVNPAPAQVHELSSSAVPT